MIKNGQQFTQKIQIKNKKTQSNAGSQEKDLRAAGGAPDTEGCVGAAGDESGAVGGEGEGGDPTGVPCAGWDRARPIQSFSHAPSFSRIINHHRGGVANIWVGRFSGGGLIEDGVGLKSVGRNRFQTWMDLGRVGYKWRTTSQLANCVLVRENGRLCHDCPIAGTKKQGAWAKSGWAVMRMAWDIWESVEEGTPFFAYTDIIDRPNGVRTFRLERASKKVLWESVAWWLGMCWERRYAQQLWYTQSQNLLHVTFLKNPCGFNFSLPLCGSLWLCWIEAPRGCYSRTWLKIHKGGFYSCFF